MDGGLAPSMRDPRWPLVPQPPHDPYALLLAGWIGPAPERGWRTRSFVRAEIDPARGVIQLGAAPDAAARLTEASGGFGGWRLPPHFAIGPAGDLYLLDRANGALARFDPCTCCFVAAPCGLRLARVPKACDAVRPQASTGLSVALNVVSAPSAIAICDGDLWIADTGHARVLRFSLAGFVPRGAIRLPPAAGLAAGSWRPLELAFDGRGTLYVLDGDHARIDRFDIHRHWIGPVVAWPGLEHLTIDCSDRLIAVAQSSTAAGVVVDGTVVPLAPVFVAFDGGFASVDWRTVAFNGIGASTKFHVDVAIGDQVLTPVELAQLDADRWTRWQSNVDASRNGRRLRPPVDPGRSLWLRIVPVPASAASAVTIDTEFAHALRWGDPAAAPEPIDVRASQLTTMAMPNAAFVVRAGADGGVQIECCGSLRSYDSNGRPIESPAPKPQYQREGTVAFAPLDSHIDGCQWHRIELRGSVPPGCRIQVETTCSAIELHVDELDGLPAHAWLRHEPFESDSVCERDLLVRSEPGRFLWMRLALFGDGSATPCIESILVEYPRVSLRRYLPAVFGFDRAGADFTDRYSELYDRTLRSFERHVDQLASLFDPLSTPASAPAGKLDFLSWLATWVGVALARDWSEARRRWFLKQAARLYCLRGTPDGLWRQLLLLLGFDRALDACRAERPRVRCVPRPLNCAPPPACTPALAPPLILEHFKLRRWLHAGHGRLGADSELWGARIVNRSQLGVTAQVGATRTINTPDPLRDPFHVYAHKFSVFVPAAVRCSGPDRRALEQLLAMESPAHTLSDIRYVEPRFRVGVQAMIGLDAVVARTPSGVTLTPEQPGPGQALGQATVLSGAPHVGDSPRVGDARVGSSVLN
jgi:phage tail-like protein